MRGFWTGGRYCQWFTSLDRQGYVLESIIKMKTEKAAGPSELVSKIVQSAGEARINMKANVINYITVKTAVKEEW